MGKIAKVKPYTIENGDGIRVSIFFSGCEHYCKNCFNSDTWDFNGGQEFKKEDLDRLLKYGEDVHVCGLSVLGGEPLNEKNVDGVIEVCKAFREKFPDKSIWLWSGYTYENINDNQRRVLDYLDVLVDGQFVDELKDFRLKYRGSSNQRFIDVKNSSLDNIVSMI